MASKSRWLPPFNEGPPSTIKITYPLFEWAKIGGKGLVPVKPLTLKSPPKDGDTEPQDMSWDKVVPGMMLRIRVSIILSQLSLSLFLSFFFLSLSYLVLI